MEKSLSPLSEYILRLNTSDSQYPCTDEFQNVRHDINQMCETVVEQLKEKYKLFADCRLLKGGSVHEQLKIGQLDEFDFMIEMPQLADKSVLSFTISKSTANIKYRWKTLSILNDLLPIDAKQLISQFDMLPV
ncbi:unnamed protein product, partial [Didymodactylos carnosus]